MPWREDASEYKIQYIIKIYTASTDRHKTPCKQN